MSINEIKEKITPIFKKYGVKKASIFGSVARGESIQNDVDILVDIKRPMGIYEFIGLQCDLQQVLEGIRQKS